MNSVIRITDKKVSVVTKTTLSSEAILEIYTVGHEKSQKAKNAQEELFHSPYTLEAKEDGAIALNVSVNSLYETLSAAVTSEHAVLKLKRYHCHHLRPIIVSGTTTARHLSRSHFQILNTPAYL